MIKHTLTAVVLLALVACTPPAPDVNLEGPSVDNPPPAELVDTPPEQPVKVQ